MRMIKGQCVQQELCPCCNLIAAKLLRLQSEWRPPTHKSVQPWERAGWWKRFFKARAHGATHRGWHGKHADQHNASSFPMQGKIPQMFHSLREWLALSSEIKKWIILKWSDLWRAEELKEWEMYYFSRERKCLMQFWTEFSNMMRIYMKHTEATFDVSSWK